ncbi:MAG: adenosylcobinamide-GDP ribazoletransferase [Acutalibacteraceae bacterium]
MIQTVIVAFSMFSAVPMPRIEWSRENMRYALCAFPLVGAVIGLICWGWSALCGCLALPALLRGAGQCLLPVLLTGGIHLDGYADTCDALASHAPPEKKREILRDPHLGAFAAIRLCCYFVASFAIWAAMPRSGGSVLILVFCLSRAFRPCCRLVPAGEKHGACPPSPQRQTKRVCRILAAASGLLGRHCAFRAGAVLRRP